MPTMKVGTDGPQTGLPAAQELLPCPICGGPPSVSEDRSRAGCEGMPRAHHEWFDLPAEEWNRRAPSSERTTAPFLRITDEWLQHGIAGDPENELEAGDPFGKRADGDDK